LKEYQNRWYIFGRLAGNNEWRIFGIDRISELTVTDISFTPDKKEDPAIFFENYVGVSLIDEPEEEVLLSFSPMQAKYINTLPLHKSQQVVKKSDEEVIFSYHIVPTFEFKQKILIYGSEVKVLKPDLLAEEIKTTLKEAWEQYK
jgi:predicted DNA-binding transcriptional regulator YafY